MSKRRGYKPTLQISSWVYLAVGFFLLIFVFSILRSYKNRVWDGNSRFTVIDYIQGESNQKFVSVRSFDPILKEGIVVKLPRDLEIQTLDGRGVWRLQSLSVLSDRFGKKWASDSIANTLGVPILGFKSELGLWDRIMSMFQSKSYYWKDIELEDSYLIDSKKTIDGKPAIALSGLWSKKAREWFVSTAMARESVPIVLVNTTEIPRLGAHAARFFDSSGMRVIAVNSEPSKPSQVCEILGTKSMGKSLAVGFIIRWFDCKFLLVPEIENITVRLGTEYQHRWFDTQ